MEVSENQSKVSEIHLKMSRLWHRLDQIHIHGDLYLHGYGYRSQIWWSVDPQVSYPWIPSQRSPKTVEEWVRYSQNSILTVSCSFLNLFSWSWSHYWCADRLLSIRALISTSGSWKTVEKWARHSQNGISAVSHSFLTHFSWPWSWYGCADQYLVIYTHYTTIRNTRDWLQSTPHNAVHIDLNTYPWIDPYSYPYPWVIDPWEKSVPDGSRGTDSHGYG